jgi:hypothetical protein
VKFSSIDTIAVAAKDTEPEPETEKEPGVPTLWAKSLHCLAASVGDEDGTKLGMYLNIPTTALISIRHRGLEEGLSEQEVVANILIFWKLMRQAVSEKTLVRNVNEKIKMFGWSHLALYIFFGLKAFIGICRD